jgi:hypothetical protein
MMVETCNCMETRNPQDCVAKPRVDARDGHTCAMRDFQDRWKLHACEQPQGVCLRGMHR